MLTYSDLNIENSELFPILDLPSSWFYDSDPVHRFRRSTLHPRTKFGWLEFAGLENDGQENGLQQYNMFRQSRNLQPS